MPRCLRRGAPPSFDLILQEIFLLNGLVLILIYVVAARCAVTTIYLSFKRIPRCSQLGTKPPHLFLAGHHQASIVALSLRYAQRNQLGNLGSDAKVMHHVHNFAGGLVNLWGLLGQHARGCGPDDDAVFVQSSFHVFSGERSQWPGFGS